MTRRDQRHIGLWLFICCGFVYAMLALGGITRLTGSGLSIVEWQPIVGFLPPMNLTDWQELFAKYQLSPEFRHINHDMDLEGFKGIFWLEFWHRVLGRAIGLVFFIPYVLFLWMGKMDRPMALKLGAIFLLGGLQGLMGWLMVHSGLILDPHVSAYRLTAHLGLAFLLYGLMLWMALHLFIGEEGRPTGRAPEFLHPISLGLLFLLSITILSGGFMAGAKAGYGYNTFPLMAGQWFPDAYWEMELGWRNFFENVATIQWNHRILAILTVALIVTYWNLGRQTDPPPQIRIGLNWLLFAIFVQATLGIATLLLLMPINLALAHQVWSMAVFTVALVTHYHLETGTSKAGWS